MSCTLKFRCRHADADLKRNIEGYNYFETTLVYILKKQNIFNQMCLYADEILEIHLLKTPLEASIGIFMYVECK